MDMPVTLPSTQFVSRTANVSNDHVTEDLSHYSERDSYTHERVHTNAPINISTHMHIYAHTKSHMLINYMCVEAMCILVYQCPVLKTIAQYL